MIILHCISEMNKKRIKGTLYIDLGISSKKGQRLPVSVCNLHKKQHITNEQISCYSLLSN